LAFSKHDSVPFQAEQSSSISFAIGIERSETVNISRVEILDYPLQRILLGDGTPPSRQAKDFSYRLVLQPRELSCHDLKVVNAAGGNGDAVIDPDSSR
jgi:hypothetical protein